jgi:hypothetical protein
LSRRITILLPDHFIGEIASRAAVHGRCHHTPGVQKIGLGFALGNDYRFSLKDSRQVIQNLLTTTSRLIVSMKKLEGLLAAILAGLIPNLPV